MLWSSIKETLIAKWKWLVVSALAVAWITASCGVSESFTKPVCTVITTAIHGLLSRTATPTPVPTNNLEPATTSIDTINYNPHTSPTSSARCGEQIKITKYATSTAANTATQRKGSGRIITSAYLIIRSTINTSGKMTRGYTHTPLNHFKNTGPGDLPQWPNSICERRLIPPVTLSKKSREKEPKITICDVTNMAKPIGSYPNTYACRLAATSPVG